MFKWDNDYDNTEQVRPFLAAFLAVKAEIEATGGYPYNRSFKGRVPGIEGEDEDTAIYLLQCLAELDVLAVKVADYIASGGEHITEAEGIKRLASVVCYGYYMGGTGWTEHKDVRLVARDGRPYAVLPKGRRTQGYALHGHIMGRVA